MERRLLSRVGGFVHDISALTSLSDEPNNIRLLSDRSLYVLQNLSQEDITFLSRYGELLGGDFYLPVEAGSPEASDVQDAVDLIRRDLNDMSVEDLLECICTNLTVLSEQGANEGQDVEGPDSNGEISVGPGEQFPDQATYFNAKCSAANAIYDTVKGASDWLVDNNVDLILNLFGGITSGVTMMLIVAGPVGWAIKVVSSVVIAIAGYLISENIDFDDLSDALDDTHDEAVQALYNASDGVTARANFIEAVAAGTPAITAVEEGLLSLMLSSEALDQLFSPREDVADYTSPDPVDCGTTLAIWTFPSDTQSWTFRDDSTANASAIGSYNASLEALKHTQEIVQGGSQRITRAVDVSPVLSIAVTASNAVFFDFDAVSDGVVVARKITVTYVDTSEFVAVKTAHVEAGTLILDLTETGTIEKIELETSRSNGTGTTGYNFITNTLEVRVA